MKFRQFHGMNLNKGFVTRFLRGNLFQCLFERCIAEKGGMAVSAVWRLVNFLALIGAKVFAEAGRDACAPLQKFKSKMLFVLAA
jgi:hypothetical protein